MKSPSVISLFSGAGGLDYGFHAAGYRTAVATDFEPDACETLRHNGFEQVICGDIHEVSSEALLEAAGVVSGEVDVLIGGPPCQPFSKSGYWATGKSARLEDPRAKTLDAYLRVLEDTRPRAFLLENVEGLAYNGKSEGIDFLLGYIEGINARAGTNYKPVGAVLAAAEFGVPQLRSRFFLIGARDGTDFRFPETTHVLNGDLVREPYRTAWDALADVVPGPEEDLRPRGKWASLLASIPEGENYLYHTDRGKGLPLFGWRRRYWTFLLKLAKTKPSWTIQAQPGPAVGPFHWSNRLLSHRELCRIQTFPDSVTILGNRRSVQRQVGNAVPSLLAEVLAREISAQVLDREVSGPLLLLPPRREVVPPPERLAPVPESFLHLAGEHEAHPGTGKGYGALGVREEPPEYALLYA
jgi:DNA (cytosine-5)-methyltransferase 1